MKLLERAKGAAPETEQEQPPSAPQGARTCRACGAAMEPEQDWCLNCGTAAPGRLGDRPGWRAASTVMALTAVLVLGAVAASYAALHDSKKKQQTVAAAPVQPQPEVPPATTPPAAQRTTPPPTQSTPTTPKATNTLPKVKTPTTPPATSTPPLTSAPPPASTPAQTTPPASTPSQSTPSTGTQPNGSTQPRETGPTPIELAASAGTMYDPYGRASASGDTAKALDGDSSTSWYVDPKDPQQVAVGYNVDVGKLRGIREIELTTPTPGFRIEIYATDEAQPPPDILDTRWSHITNVSDVGAKGDGKQTMVLGAGTSKYRNLLLWVTKPPTDAPRVRLSEIKLLG
jgi:hypothetical protein